MLGCFLLQSDGAVNSIATLTDSALSSDAGGESCSVSPGS